jgi:predicted DNA-binding ribbon-helix-helix protein
MPRTFPKVRTQPKSQIRKRSVVIAGHYTSVSLEDAFWVGLKEAADVRGTSVANLVAQIANQVVESNQINLSSALRTFVLAFYRDQVQQHKERAKLLCCVILWACPSYFIP